MIVITQPKFIRTACEAPGPGYVDVDSISSHLRAVVWTHTVTLQAAGLFSTIGKVDSFGQLDTLEGHQSNLFTKCPME